ncbi:outer membrane protein assembly factor BamA [Roseiarcaceae bacterium H3SJ34-1]|uniref:outer membrane protein assembly factor BamA n=1 Tax=Terripilifer ovatus TaxID=3032367 RepID=UPI003AB997ED|nr:outer membrane protein assembly factor BamA [Roseiarcaceae bacterium H3SJ34-1]
MRFISGYLYRLAFAALVGSVVAFSAISPASAQQIVVQGSQRVDAETIRSYFGGTDEGRINQAVKDLYATGLFADVKVRREGGRIVVAVVENSIINRVAFEGNSKIKSDSLIPEVQSKSRGAYNPATVQADIERIKDLYRRAGRGAATVSSRTVALPNGRLDVVFTIAEGGKTGVRDIEFTGNHAYSSYRLRNLMQTTEMNWLSFFKNTDVYDPDKISADLEIIRRFYLKNGYADFRIVSNDARYDEAREGWIITIGVDEGAQYRVSSVNVESRIADIDPAVLRSNVRLKEGDVYNGDLVEKSVEGITREVARKGYAFSSARPRGDRNPAAQTIALSFVVEEGPRVYIERIVVKGNTRTRDYVIRREFDIGEGDAYNRVLIERAERRLNNLGFFKKVRITNEPGSSPDRVVVVVDVEDQPTGSFGISGGYSTTDGVIGEVSVSESNFQGRGQFVRVATTLGQRTRGIDFSFTEPYFMGYRMSAGFDLFAKQTLNSVYSVYESRTFGGALRAGIPITDEISLGVRYSLYYTKISIPNDINRPYNDCVFPIPGITPGPYNAGNPPPPGTVLTCVSNGEASVAIKDAALRARTISMPGYSLIYNTLDNAKNPTSGAYAELRQDVAGLGGNARFVKSTGEIRYYYPIFEDVVGFVKLQGGNLFGFGGNKPGVLDNFNLGPSLVRGFAPGGIGPRDVSSGLDNRSAGLGGTTYFGATAEVQFPIYGLPKEVGMKGALFVDAGTLYGYKGKTEFNQALFLPPGTPCQPTLFTSTGVAYTQSNCINVRDEHKIRASVGASIIWASPLGPIRFDYAIPFSKVKDQYVGGVYQGGDVTQYFRFSGGGTF